MKNNIEKDKIRKNIARLKKQYSLEDLYRMSEEVLSVLEITGIFNDAFRICIYNALNDEVSTAPFIEKWRNEKEFYLPVIENNKIVLRKCQANTTFTQSNLGVYEPEGENLKDLSAIDLFIIPGVAFDRKANRLGRGKGYYDKFLSRIKAPKAGICFDFQLLDQIPCDEWDVKMDMIVSENDLIW